MKKWIISNKKYIFIFFISIIIHWAILFLAFTIFSKAKDASSSFFKHFYDYYIQCGDTVHYLHIAQYGYPTIGASVNLIVFFPLYPFLIRIFNVFVNDYFISGVIISNICMGISVCLLYYLANEELKNHHKALESVYMYLLYPFSVFLIACYTESLFIMLSLLCLIFIKKQRWLLVGIIGMLCSLTRIQGIIFLAPSIYQIVVKISHEKKFDWRYLYIFITLIGFMIYLILNKIIAGNYFSFLEFEKSAPWYNSAQWISNNLAQHYNFAFQYVELGYIIYGVQLLLFFVAIYLLFLGLKSNVGRYLIIYGTCYIILTYSHGWMISGPRYILSCVPLYIIFPTIKNDYVRNIILVLMALLSLFYTFCSVSGYAIM